MVSCRTVDKIRGFGGYQEEVKFSNEAQKCIESKHMCGESTNEAQIVVWIFTAARVSGNEVVN